MAHAQVPEVHRLTHRRILVTMVVGLAALSAVFVALALLLRPAPPKPCPSIFKCGGPIVSNLEETGNSYTSSEYGFSLRYQENVDIKKSANQIAIPVGISSLEQGQLLVAGVPADGQTPAQLVAGAQLQLEANAEFAYDVPNPYIGYQPAFGEAYNFEVNGASNSESLGRMIILAAVRDNLGIVVVDIGPYDLFSNSNTAIMNLNDHASPADQYGALVFDPVVNSILWRGESLFSSTSR
jgi:hypothetical protein